MRYKAAVLILSIGFSPASFAKKAKPSLDLAKWTCVVFEKNGEIPTVLQFSNGKMQLREYVKDQISEQNPLGETWTALPEKYSIKTSTQSSSEKTKVVEFFSSTKKNVDLSLLRTGKGSDPESDDISNCPYEVQKSQWGNSGYCFNSTESCGQANQ